MVPAANTFLICYPTLPSTTCVLHLPTMCYQYATNAIPIATNDAANMLRRKPNRMLPLKPHRHKLYTITINITKMLPTCYDPPPHAIKKLSIFRQPTLSAPSICYGAPRCMKSILGAPPCAPTAQSVCYECPMGYQCAMAPAACHQHGMCVGQFSPICEQCTINETIRLPSICCAPPNV